MTHLRVSTTNTTTIMRRLPVILMAAIIGTAFLTPSSDAGIGKHRPRKGTLPTPGPQLSFYSGHDFDLEAWNLGTGAIVPLGRRGLRFMPSGEMIFTADDLSFQGNADLVLGRRLLYFGGGLAVLSTDFEDTGNNETELGANLLAGVRFPARRSPVRPYIETRWTILEDHTLFKLRFGLSIPLGGR